MKATIRLHTSDRKKSRTYPIIVNVSHKGKRNRKQIGISIPEDWDDNKKFPLPTHPDYDNLYVTISMIKAKSQTSNFMNLNDVKEAITLLVNENDQKKINFIDFCQKKIDHLNSINRDGTAYVYQSVLNDFKIFKGSCNIDEINTSLIEKYKEYRKSNKFSNSGIKTYIGMLKTMYNSCCRINAIPNLRPFEGVVKDLPHSRRRAKNVYLDTKTILKLEKIDTKFKTHQRAIDLTLLQFYLGGQYLIDIYYLQKNQINKQRAFFKRIKLGDKAEEFDVKIFKKAQDIIDKYKSEDSEFLFPWNKDKKRYRVFYQKHRENLRRVFEKYELETLPKNDPILTRSPRHTFATIGKFKGIDVDIIREIMGHERNDMDTVYKDKFPQKVKDKAHWEIIKT
ncbi:tyrosine-type recombinase/integrase [Aquimarina algiphila]|uniref:Site-specific integrase n=1 Tax=Aquimarina algiphila TaxID=2047982 RepID=A0A554VDZ4_9FLAO|nr:site-specific integrase [Aquimarina algiphila]TSE05207.1 site-specific integrase [Aquimarina algiphila]